MSFALSAPLQSAIYAALSADSALDAQVGGAIYDAVPQGSLPDLYVRLGSETVEDASDCSAPGAVHWITVSVITTDPGFAAAKAAAGAVSDVLHDADLTLSRGHLISLRFDSAKAQRIEGSTARQIDLRFRARVDDS